jgi:hypothetical protein
MLPSERFQAANLFVLLNAFWLADFGLLRVSRVF